MTRDFSVEETNDAFWLNYPDQTQAAVHLALQWLAHVYPASELHIDATLKHAQPYADADLSSRWSQFLEEHDVEEHVIALQWIKETFSTEQIPFLVETCWRLLLIDHELPVHVPLALRILGRVLDVEETKMFELGETVYREFIEENENRNRAPLLPVDPRYLDRIEWRLFGSSATHRHGFSSRNRHGRSKNKTVIVSFVTGACFGAAVVLFLVFGPMQLGRVKVPIMLHDGLLLDTSRTVEAPAMAETAIDNTAQAAIADPEIDNTAQADATESVIENTEQPEITVTESPVVSAEVETNANTDKLSEPGVSGITTAPEQLDADPASVTAETDVAGERVLMQVTASILNVRAQPNVDSAVLIKLGTGAQVWAYPAQAEGLWTMIRVEGITGYASARFLAEVE